MHQTRETRSIHNSTSLNFYFIHFWFVQWNWLLFSVLHNYRHRRRLLFGKSFVAINCVYSSLIAYSWSRFMTEKAFDLASQRVYAYVFLFLCKRIPTRKTWTVIWRWKWNVKRSRMCKKQGVNTIFSNSFWFEKAKILLYMLAECRRWQWENINFLKLNDDRQTLNEAMNLMLNSNSCIVKLSF